MAGCRTGVVVDEKQDGSVGGRLVLSSRARVGVASLASSCTDHGFFSLLSDQGRGCWAVYDRVEATDFPARNWGLWFGGRTLRFSACKARKPHLVGH